MRMPNNFFTLLNQLRADPKGFLGRCGIDIPEGTTDTDAIIKQIMGTGRVSQAQYNGIMSMRNMFRR